MVTIPDKQEVEEGLPPAYQDSTEALAVEYTPDGYTSEAPPDFSQASSSTAPPPPTTPLVPPTNFITIKRKNEAVKGTYSIDPTLPCPPGVKPSVGEGGKDLHMYLESQNGSVNAVVEVIRSPDAKGPARLEATSRNGSVSIKMHDRQQNHFRLRVTADNGAIKVQVPSTFTGTVSTLLKNGSLKFSPGVQARLATFSERDGEGRFFIGDYVASGYDGDETWLMDHLRAEALNGRVKISFTDEDDDGTDSTNGSKGKGSASGKGFFNRIFGGS